MASVRDELKSALANIKVTTEGPRRPVVDFPKDSKGLFIQPDKLTPKLAIEIDHNRVRMTKKWQYADEFCGDTKTLDKTTRYNCGGCNQAQGGICLLVYDEDEEEDAQGRYPALRIDRIYGSCGHWEMIDSGDPELRGSRMSKALANYGVRVGGTPDSVFGCRNCWKKKPTKWHDNTGEYRLWWCGEGGTPVGRNACCTLNGAPVKDDDDEY